MQHLRRSPGIVALKRKRAQTIENVRCFDNVAVATERFLRLTIIMFGLRRLFDFAIYIRDIGQHAANGRIVVVAHHLQTAFEHEQRIAVIADPAQRAAHIFELLRDRRAIAARFGHRQCALEVAQRIGNALLTISQDATATDPFVSLLRVVAVDERRRGTAEGRVGLIVMTHLDLRIGQRIQRIGIGRRNRPETQLTARWFRQRTAIDGGTARDWRGMRHLDDTQHRQHRPGRKSESASPPQAAPPCCRLAFP